MTADASRRQAARHACAALSRPIGARDAAQGGGQRGQPFARIGHQRQGVVLAGIEGLHVQPDQIRPAEQSARAGGEILQPRADGEHHIRGLRRAVRRRRAGHADGAEVERMIVRQGALAGLGFGDRNAMRVGEAASAAAASA